MNRLSMSIAAAITSLSLVAGTAIASGHPYPTIHGKKRATKVRSTTPARTTPGAR